MSSPSAQLPLDLDLEKGAAWAWPAATKEEELAVVYPRVVKYMFALDAIYLVLSYGLIGWTMKVSNDPRDAWPVVIIAWLVWMLLLGVSLLLAKKCKPGSDDGDLSTKLLVASKK